MRKIRNRFGSLAIIGVLAASLNLVHASTNTLWLSVASVSNGWVNLILHGTTPGTNYVLLSKQTLTAPSWSNAGAMTGAANQDWTPISVPVGAQSSCFFQAQSATGQTTSTNLWLEIPTNALATPGQLTVVIHNTLPDQFYDVLTNSSLTVSGLWNVEQSVFGAVGDSTTVQLPMNGPALFMRARYGVDSTGSGIPDWWWQQYFGSVGGDPFAFDPSGDGFTLWQDYWEGLNPTVFKTPPAPQGLAVINNMAANQATICWQASPGPVTGYTVEKTDDNAYTVQDFNVSTTSYQDDISGNSPDPDFGGSYRVSYRVKAHYSSGGDSAWSVRVPLQQPTVSGWIIPGIGGVTYLAVSGLPANAVAVRLDYYDWYAVEYYEDFSFNSYRDIPVSSFTNGYYPLPSSWQSSGVDAYGFTVEPFYVQSVDAGGNVSAYGSIFVDFWNQPFSDGRVALKQDLTFLLRAASESSPLQFIEYDTNYFFGGSGEAYNPYTGELVYAYHFSNPGNYAWVSPFRGNGGMADGNNQFFSYYANEPFDDNYRYWNFVYNPANVDDSGSLVTGAFSDGILFLSDPIHDFVAGETNTWLATNQTRWLYSQWESDSYWGSDTSITTPDGLNYSMAGNARNLYGLPYVSALFFYNDESGLETATLSATHPLSLPNSPNVIYVETAQPKFQTAEYDFWQPVTTAAYADWELNQRLIPGMNGFSPTNKSQLMIISAGSYLQIAGYAKLAVTNGYPGVYGYLGQYFDRAYTEDANGIATTNVTGFVTPNGFFFATEPGTAALVTMPDIDTGERGTCTVNCISANVDKNNDGTMDLSWNGPDATSQASPYRIWVNYWHTVPGTGGDLDHDVENRGYASPNYSQGKITCQRDLENFFRLWICGLPKLPASQGYTVTLSMSPSSGNPAINLYAQYDTNGSAAYLTDTNAAQQQFTQQFLNGQLMFDYSQKLGTISSSQSYTLPVHDDGRPIFTHFLFEGAGIGAGQLTMTISQNGNTIAQTGVWLDLHDVKDFYERANAENVTSGLPPSSLVSQCQIDHVTVTAPDETKQVIVFVHGINNSPFDYFDSTETLFKRLYWSGYHGKVAGFRWPCAYLPSGSSINPADYLKAFNFNKGEFYAWKSAAAFKDYLNYLKNRPDLAGYQIDIIAHSQGNIVASEAVKQGAPFDNYILTQAAAPAHCYDTGTAFQQDLLSEESYSPTPLYPANGGYHGYFAGLTGSLINFYNTNDYALISGTVGSFNVSWEQNEIKEKPQNYPFILAYGWDSTNCFSIAGIFGSKVIVTDPYEQMSMVARSRTHALGAQPGVGGTMKTSAEVDLKAAFGFGATREEHSAQFTWPVQRTAGYYQAILNQIQPTP